MGLEVSFMEINLTMLTFSGHPYNMLNILRKELWLLLLINALVDYVN